MKKILITILIIGFLATSAYTVESGFTTKCVNDTDSTVIYYLVWVNHDFPRYPYPIPMAVGELKPGKEHLIKHRYSAGIWIVRWRSLNGGVFFEETLDIGEDVTEIILTPSKSTLIRSASAKGPWEFS